MTISRNKPVTLLGFQVTAVEELGHLIIKLGNRQRRQSITLDSPTGSGKTTMIAETIRQHLAGKTVIFLTPGKGKLGKQSTRALARQLSNSGVRVAELALTNLGARPTGNEVFVGTYESLVTRDSTTKQYKNVITRHDGVGEKETFWSWLREPGAEVVFIIDEAHYGKGSAKGAIRLFIEDMHDALGYFPLTLEASATPMYVYEKTDTDVDTEKVVVPVEDAIAEGLLRKSIVVNNTKLGAARARFNPKLRSNATAIPVLLSASILQQDELDEAYEVEGVAERSLIGVIVPDGAEGTVVIDAVEKHLREAHNITESNGQLMKYLSDEKSADLSVLDDPNCPVRVIIYKVALATGWDCPRAQISVGFRMTKSRVLSRQNRGRYLRTVGGRHYQNEALNQMYVYSNENSFLEGIFDEGAIGLTFAEELTADAAKAAAFCVPSLGKARTHQKPFKASLAVSLWEKHKAAFLRSLDYHTVSLDRSQVMLSGELDAAEYLRSNDDSALSRSNVVLSTAPSTLKLQNEVQRYIEEPVEGKSLNFGNNSAAAEAITMAVLRKMLKEAEFQTAHSSYSSMTPAEYFLALVTSDILVASGKERNAENVAAVRNLVRAMVTDPDAPTPLNGEGDDVVDLDSYALKYTGNWTPALTRHVKPNPEALLDSSQRRGRLYQPVEGSDAYALVPLSGPEKRFESSFIADKVNNGIIEWFEHNGDDPSDFSVAAVVDSSIVVCRPDYISMMRFGAATLPAYFEVKGLVPSASDRVKAEAVTKHSDYTGVFGAVVYEARGEGKGWYVLRNNDDAPEALEEYIARFQPHAVPAGLTHGYSVKGYDDEAAKSAIAALS